MVSTPTGAIAEMLGDGDTGILVPERDPAAMAEAVAALLDDPDRAIAHGAPGAARHRGLYLAAVRERWAAAYGDGA